MGRSSTSLLLLATLAATTLARPWDPATQSPATETFEKFFRIKDLIDKINIKHFREFQGRKVDGGPPAIEAEAPQAEDGGPPSEASDSGLMEIDLTEEAISNDAVTKVVVEDPEPEVVTDSGVDPGAFEEVDLHTDCLNNLCLNEAPVETTTKATDETTTVETDVPDNGTTTEALADAEEVGEEVVGDTPIDEINEIDTDGFVVSSKSIASAKKYGYKILLKRIGGAKVPVGRIKFTVPELPTLVEFQEVTTEPAAEETTEAAVAETTAAAQVTTAATASEASSAAEETTEAAVAETTAAAKVTTAAAAPETSSPAAETTAAVEVTTTAAVVTTAAAEVRSVDTTLAPVEATTSAEVTFADPIVAVLPEIATIDQSSIEEGALQVAADAELAVVEMANMNTSVAFPAQASCSVALLDGQKLLVDLATKIVESAGVIEEILAVARGIKEEVDLAALSLSGARLLQLLEPFLASLVPAEIESCPDTSTNSIVMTMTGLAASLDTIAEEPGTEEDRAQGLHQAATSLQLAAWVMAQMEASVHTMYSGLCEGGRSTADILAALAAAMDGYAPMLAVLSTETSVEELKATTEALQDAANDLAGVEERSGSALPGVECGASFAAMGRGLERLAAFLEASQAV